MAVSNVCFFQIKKKRSPKKKKVGTEETIKDAGEGNNDNPGKGGEENGDESAEDAQQVRNILFFAVQ